MDLEEIKNLMKLDKGKFIIVEEGKPVLVVVSFEDYKKMVGNPERLFSQQPAPSEKSNSEVQDFSSEETDEESLNIEDLPV